MNRLALWLDNPILIKHVRSRLRRMQALPAVAVVMILCLCIVMIGYQYDRLAGGGSFGAIMALQAVILGVIGASQVTSSVGKARESGILDFHRVSPMPPSSLTMGFFFGAPIREYAMFAATLPFSLACVYMGRPGFGGFLQLLACLLMLSWTLHAMALMGSLAWKTSKAGPWGLIGLVVLLIFGSGPLFAGSYFVVLTVDEWPPLHFYLFELPWLLVLALDMFPPIGFLLVASARRMASERAHVLSKPEAVAALATGAFLLVGGLWNIESSFFWTLVVLYSLMLAAMVLTATITPTRDEFAKGVRRAAKEGRRLPSPWEDRGLNRLALMVLCAITLIASTVAWKSIEEPNPMTMPGVRMTYSLPIAIGVLTVAYVGLALQYFKLRFARRASVFQALFLLAVWLLPILVGFVSATAAERSRAPGSGPDVVSPALFSLCPIVGIALSGGGSEVPGFQAVRAAALVPALVFALLFNNLVTAARRRVEKEVRPDEPPRPAPGGKPPAGVAELIELA